MRLGVCLQITTPEKQDSNDMTSHHVQQWLVSYGLQRHIGAFAAGGIDGGTLLTLNSEALKTLGVTSPSERAFMKKKIKELRLVHEREKRQVDKKKKAEEKQVRKSAGATSPLKKKSA